MLPAIVAIRTAVATAEETTRVPRHPLPAAERSEAIQKILDALTRHLSGKEVLSKDALVKLVEDLALILKFPPLPRETGRAFIRRLTGFIEALPMPERLLLERQLSTRSLARRVAVAATMPADRRGAIPPDRTPLRSLPLPARVPPLAPHPGAKASLPGELALLQTMFKKVYGGDMDGVHIETTQTGAAREEAVPAEPGRSPRTPANAPQAPRNAEVATRSTATGALEGKTPETLSATVEGSDEKLPENEAGSGGPPAARGTQAAGLNRSVRAVLEDARAATGEGKAAGAKPGAESPPGNRGFEGADGAPHSTGEDDMPRVRVQSAGRAPQTAAETVKAIIRDSLPLPGTSKGWQAAGAGGTGTAVLPPPESKAAAPPLETTGAMRSAVAGGEPPVDVAPDAEPGATLPDMPPPHPGRKAGEDVVMPQGFARLPESGLPREMVPFALVPYPPAEESDADEVDRRERESESEAERDSRDDEGERKDDDRQQENAAGGERAQAEEQPVADAFDLYRKLGGLA